MLNNKITQIFINAPGTYLTFDSTGITTTSDKISFEQNGEVLRITAQKEVKTKKAKSVYVSGNTGVTNVMNVSGVTMFGGNVVQNDFSTNYVNGNLVSSAKVSPKVVLLEEETKELSPSPALVKNAASSSKIPSLIKTNVILNGTVKILAVSFSETMTVANFVAEAIKTMKSSVDEYSTELIVDDIYNSDGILMTEACDNFVREYTVKLVLTKNQRFSFPPDTKITSFKVMAGYATVEPSIFSNSVNFIIGGGSVDLTSPFKFDSVIIKIVSGSINLCRSEIEVLSVDAAGKSKVSYFHSTINALCYTTDKAEIYGTRKEGSVLTEHRCDNSIIRINPN